MKSEHAIDLLLQPSCYLLWCSLVVQRICPGIYNHGSLDVMLRIVILSGSDGTTSIGKQNGGFVFSRDGTDFKY
jgi:hypothetical protein